MVTSAPGSHFFGYYDKCPWDGVGRRLLCHRVDFDAREPSSDDRAVITLVHLDIAPRREELAETCAWNFQQGAMLGWHPRDAENTVFFNDIQHGAAICRLLDVRNRRERVLPRAVSAWSPCGRYAASVNYAGLADTRPGYGYAGIEDPHATEPAPADDGLFLLDLERDESKLAVSLRELAATGPARPPTGAKQWVNVPLFSPDSERLCFVHRWRDASGGLFTRLFGIGRDGSHLRCLAHQSPISHFDWRDAQHLLVWAAREEASVSARTLVREAARRLASFPAMVGLLMGASRRWLPGVGQAVRGERFVLLRDPTGNLDEIGLRELTEDGHCSFSPDRRWVLLDTYPDDQRWASVLLYRPENRLRVEVARVLAPKALAGAVRCDLHPRFSRDGRRICVDTAHTGRRQLCVLDVTRIVAEG